tara:strand:+ start:719 stop:1387 length:669 start_codon:yes stop_codon:yes gene_type:complete
MRVLHHYPLSPSSRLIRLYLSEKNINFVTKLEVFWERNEAYLKLNPSGEVPTLIDQDNTVLCGANVIIEYFEELESNSSLMPVRLSEKSEVRRLVDWFENKFYREVTFPLLNNRVIKRFFGDQNPSSEIIRSALQNLKVHLPYLEWLTENRKWIAGDNFSVADLAAASQLSVLDFMNDLEWFDYGESRAWYAKIKSRPSFRLLLRDVVEGINPPSHYNNLDF